MKKTYVIQLTDEELELIQGGQAVSKPLSDGSDILAIVDLEGRPHIDPSHGKDEPGGNERVIPR